MASEPLHAEDTASHDRAGEERANPRIVLNLASDLALPPGELLSGRFVIEHLAAVGGMSAVYRATDRELHTPVAVKVLTDCDPVSGKRFVTEANILAKLSHPAAVQFIAHGVTPQGAPYLALEWLDGEDLATRLARLGLCLAETQRLLRPLVGAIEAAHAHGVLHRDVKPSNVFLVDGSVSAVKLIDFGVARYKRDTRVLTRPGSLVGTVGYMSPEQARGDRDLDARTDVFSLGCLLFECLTGQPAFAGSHDLAVLAKILCDEPPPLSSLRPELSEVDGVLRSMLAKDRAARPRSAAAALSALEKAFARVRHVGEANGLVPVRSRYAEQRIASVILGHPQPGRSSAVPIFAPPARLLAELSTDFGAEATAMRSGAVLLVLTAGPNASPTEQAIRAARSALRLSQACPELSIGVATGAVDTTARVPVGVALDRAGDLLEDSAHSIKIDALTAGLLGPRFEVCQGPCALVLVREQEGPETVDVLMGRSTPFVGRAKELAILQAMLAESLDEQTSRATLVMGPPGAGKSRLGREFVERIRRDGQVRILFARCDPSAAGSAFSLVQRLIRNAASVPSRASTTEQRATLAAYLRGVVGPTDYPAVLCFLSEIISVGESNAGSALHAAARSDPQVMREQKRRAFAHWISAESACGPLLLFLEDLHWGDLASIHYLVETTGALAQRPLFVLATSRPECLLQFPELRDAHEFSELRLHGLTRKSAEQLARAVLPPETAQSLIDNVVALAGGNAFYLEELVRRVAECDDFELPETVVAMAQSRLERLPPDARCVLRAASIFGETTWDAGVDHLLPSSDNRALLRWLVEQEILVLRADTRFPGERVYAFRHALLREAAYAMLPRVDRQNGHLRVADWLEGHGERDALVLADHFERGGASARAVPYLAKAAMVALDGGDLESAITLSRRGASLGAQGEVRGMLLLVRSYASTHKKSTFDLPAEALSLLPRASASWWLALSLHVYGASMRGAPELAEPYLQLALTTSPDHELTGPYGQAIETLASSSALIGRAEMGWALIHHFERESASRRALLDPSFVAWFNLTKCVLASHSLSEPGHWDLGKAVLCGETSIDAMRLLGTRFGEVIALYYLGNAYWMVGCYERSLALLQQCLKLARRTGNLLVEQHCKLLLVVYSLRSGARVEALAMLDNLGNSSNSNISQGAAAVLADSCLREGRHDEAIERARVVVAGSALVHRRMARGTLARAHLALHDYAEAIAVTSCALADGGPRAFPHQTVDLLRTRARALAACGCESEAERTSAQIRAFIDDAATSIDDSHLRSVFLARSRKGRPSSSTG